MSNLTVSTSGSSAAQFNFAAKYLNEYELPTMVSASQKGGKSATARAEEGVELELRIRELFRQSVQFPISEVAPGLEALNAARNSFLRQQKGFTMPLKTEVDRPLPFILQEGALHLLRNKNPIFHGIFDFHPVQKDVDVIWKTMASLVPGEGDALERGRKAFEDVMVPVSTKAQALVNASIELDQLNETHLSLITKRLQTAIKVDEAAASLKHKPFSGSVSSSSSSSSSISSTTQGISTVKDEHIETAEDVERDRAIDDANEELQLVKSSIRNLLQAKNELTKKYQTAPARLETAKQDQQKAQKACDDFSEKSKKIADALASAQKAYQDASEAFDKLTREKGAADVLSKASQVKQSAFIALRQHQQLADQAESLELLQFKLKLANENIPFHESAAQTALERLASIELQLKDHRQAKERLLEKIQALRQPSRAITPPTVQVQQPSKSNAITTDKLFDILLFCSSDEYLSMKQEEQSQALYARYEELPPGVQGILGDFILKEVFVPFIMNSDWLKQHIADDFDVLNKVIALTIEKVNQ